MHPPAQAFELVPLKSGVFSLRTPENGETFHPVVGPMKEARLLHVDQQRLLERAADGQARPLVVWDVGLGAAANAVAVLEAFAASPLRLRAIHLLSFDSTTAPLEFACSHAEALGYLLPHVELIQKLLLREEASFLTEAGTQITWKIHRGDFRQLVAQESFPAPDAILYDPYSPKANPGMWTVNHFAHLFAHLRTEVPCLLSNYTRSTAVRVTLLLAGFYVGRGRGIGEKDQTTVASNRLELLEDPLELAWLKRVSSSTKSAPLRLDQLSGPICAADWEALRAHPQFADQEKS